MFHDKMKYDPGSPFNLFLYGQYLEQITWRLELEQHRIVHTNQK